MHDPPTSVRSRSQRLKHLATAIFIALLFVLMVEVVVVARAPNPLAELQFLIGYRFAMLFYLTAIWMIRRAFVQVADGRGFDDVLPTLLSRLGMALVGGACASVFVGPWLLLLLFHSTHRSVAAFDPAAITIGLVGLLMVSLSGLVSRAAAMRRELDEIL